MANPNISVFTSGFANGAILRGVPLAQTQPGSVFWVYNGTVVQQGHRNGSDNNKGTFAAPFATIAGALAQCTANRGDIVFVRPGHAESVTAAAGIILSVAGVAVIGLGAGSNRPTITFTTVNTASITVTANNVSVQNILFLSAIAACATCFNIANAQVATDLTIDNCEFRDTSTTLNFVSVLTIGTTANIADGLTFTNNRVIGQMGTPTAATTAIVSGSNINRALIAGNFCSHQVLLAATAVLLAMGALALTNSWIKGNTVVRPNTDASNPLLFTTSSTAWLGSLVSDNYCSQLSGATGLVGNTGTKAGFINNFAMITGAADKSASINPVQV